MLCLMNVLHTLLPRAVSWFLIGFNLSQESAIVLMFLMEFSVCNLYFFVGLLNGKDAREISLG